MKRLIPLPLILLSSICSAQLYKWTDADGVVHYTDRLPSTDVNHEVLPNRLKTLNKGLKQQLEEEAVGAYETFTLLKPETGATVHSEDQTVPLEIKIEPALADDHFVQIYLDGQEVGDKTKATSLILQRIRPGAHNIYALILDDEENQLMRSETVSFTFRKALDLKKVAPNL